ncbi:MAG TPA: hypothetical protein VJ773_10430 [Gemmatimonadales bacterium]|nr:hypothetical protein [Gemmatimonadales bacterium]
MSDLHLTHLSPDDLDAWLEGRLGSARAGHLQHCGQCRDLVERERALVDLLASLPRLAPAPGLEQRIMARVRIPRPAPAAIAARRPVRASARRTAAAAAVLLGMAASVAWSLGNRELLDTWGAWLLGESSRLLWVSVQAVASNLLEQPWSQELRSFLSAPGRLLPALGAASLVYASGLLALRRLMALPTAGVAHAR